MTDLRTSVAQLLDDAENVIGAGFLVADSLLVTCAHVVMRAASGPGKRISVRFIHDSPHTLWGLVDPQFWREPEREDVAFIKLDEAAALNRSPLRLSANSCSPGRQVESFGFPANALRSGHYGYGRTGGLVEGEASQPLLQLTDCHEITSGFSGGPVRDPRTNLVVGMVNSIPGPDRLGRGQTTAYVTPIETLRQICSLLELHDDSRPYQSLDPFTEADAAWFYGRRRAIDAVFSRWHDASPFIAILGPSGSGKSSLVHAGLLPALSNERLPGSNRWECISARPGADTYSNLEAAGLTGASAGNLTTAIREWFEFHSEHSRLVIVLDQFEELLVNSAPQPAAEFLAELASLAAESLPVTVVLVMRDDFYAELAATSPELMQYVERCTVNIPGTLDHDEIEAIVTQPAERMGWNLESGLAQRIISDTFAAGGTSYRHYTPTTVLPLLEFAMTELWERRNHETGQLTHRAYEQIGGVTGGLAAWCEQTWHAVPASQRPVFRRMVTALVRPGDDKSGGPPVRRRLPLATLRTNAVGSSSDQIGNDQTNEILQLLAQRRVVVISADNEGVNVELIHDAVIEGWPQLRHWLAEDRQFLAWQAGVEHQLADWLHFRQGIPSSKQERWSATERDLLLVGKRLSDAAEWQANHSTSFDLNRYIERSRQAQRRLQRTRRLVITIVATFALVASGIIVSGIQQRQEQSRLAEIRKLLLSAAVAQRDALPWEALRWQVTAFDLATAANDEAAIEDARKSLIATMASSRYIGGILDADLAGVEAGPDGWLLTASSDGKVGLWDTRLSTENKAVALGDKARGTSWASFVVPRGVLISAETNGPLTVWDLTDRAHPRPAGSAPSGSSAITAMASVADGRRIVTGHQDGSVSLWDIADIAHPSKLATSARDGWEPRPKAPPFGVSITTRSDAIVDLAMRPDGTTFVSATNTRTTTWSLSASNSLTPIATRLLPSLATAFPDARPVDYRLTQPSPQDTKVNVVKVTPDGSAIVAGGTIAGNAAAMLAATSEHTDPKDPDTSSVIAPLPGHTLAVQHLTLSHDGRFLATWGADQTLRLWNVVDRQQPRLIGVLPNNDLREPAASSLSFSPDGQQLFVLQQDGSVAIFSTNGIATESRSKRLPQGKRFVWAGFDATITATSQSGHPRPQVAAAVEGGHIVVTGTLAARSTNPLCHISGVSICDNEDARIYVWGLGSSDQPLATIEGQPGVTAIDMSADASVAITGSAVGLIILWDTSKPSSPKELGRLNPFLDRTYTGGASLEIAALAISPDKNHLAIGSIDSGIYIYDIADPTKPVLETRLTEVPAFVPALRFSRDGSTLLAGSGDGFIRLWRKSDFLSSPTEGPGPASMVTLTEPTGSVLTSAFSPHGRLLATGTSAGTVTLWDTTNLLHPVRLQTFLGPATGVFTLSFDASGTRLIASDGNTSLTEWSVSRAAQVISTPVDIACSIIQRSLGADRLPQLSHFVYQPTC